MIISSHRWLPIKGPSKSCRLTIDPSIAIGCHWWLMGPLLPLMCPVNMSIQHFSKTIITLAFKLWSSYSWYCFKDNSELNNFLIYFIDWFKLYLYQTCFWSCSSCVATSNRFCLLSLLDIWHINQTYAKLHKHSLY